MDRSRDYLLIFFMFNAAWTKGSTPTTAPGGSLVDIHSMGAGTYNRISISMQPQPQQNQQATSSVSACNSNSVSIGVGYVWL